MAKVILDSDGMGAATAAEYEAYVDFVRERIAARTGIAVQVEALLYGSTGERVIAEASVERLLRAELEKLWTEWCATGWNEWLTSRRDCRRAAREDRNAD